LVLIDSGSTHNFVSLAHLLKLQPEEGGMDVIAASGDRIHSPGKYLQVPIEL